MFVDLALAAEQLRGKSEAVTRRSGLHTYDDLLMSALAQIILIGEVSFTFPAVEKNWDIGGIIQCASGIWT